MAAMKRALEIDPTSQWRHVGMSFQLACAKQMGAAIAEAKAAHELDPQLVAPMFDLYNLYMVQGDYKNAVSWYFKMLERSAGDKALPLSMQELFEKRGIAAMLEARITRSLDQIRAGTPVPKLSLVQQYAFLGKRDEAVQWLEKAVEERQSTVVFINQHPMYASLRGHPGFQAIVVKLKL